MNIVSIFRRAGWWFLRSPRASKLRTLWCLLRTGGPRAAWHRAAIRFGGTPTASPGKKGRSASSPRSPHKIVVYTAIFGGYDQLPPSRFSDVDMVCFTDDPRIDSDHWQIRPVDVTDPILAARQYKTLAHRWFADYEFSIWIDGNLRLLTHPAEIVERLLGRADLASFAHPERRCTYREADMVKFLKLDVPQIVDRQMQRYLDDGLEADAGLMETALVVRRHSDQVRQFNELWWSEISRGSRRDQLSVMYALWKTGVSYQFMPGGREQNDVADFFPHTSQSRSML